MELVTKVVENYLVLSFLTDNCLYEVHADIPTFEINQILKSTTPDIWAIGEFNDLFIDDQEEIITLLKELRKAYNEN